MLKYASIIPLLTALPGCSTILGFSEPKHQDTSTGDAHTADTAIDSVQPDADKCAGVVCSASDQCHLAGTCDPATGTCSNPVVQDGVACNDGHSCTVNDQCVSGSCTGTPMPTEAIDQAQPFCDSGVCSGAGSPPYWQDFLVGVTGEMTKLTVWKNGMTGQQAVTLNIYSGVGPVAANRIFSQPVTLPDVQQAYDITLQSPPHLTAGMHYTWEIIDPSGGFHTYMQPDKYPNGTSSVEMQFGGTWDLQFRTWMLPDCP